LAILFREVRRLKAHHAVQSPVYFIFRLDLAHFHPMENLGQRMDRVLQVVAPLPQRATLATAGFASRFDLRQKSAQIVEQDNQIADEWLLQRLV
jgi:hypothetical protein